MASQSIWEPINFYKNWNNVNTEKFDNIYPSWEKRRKELQKDEEQYGRFMDQLKRKQAIDTGIIERMYDLKKGITRSLTKGAEKQREYVDVSLGIPLLAMSFEKNASDLISSIRRQIEISIMSTWPISQMNYKKV